MISGNGRASPVTEPLLVGLGSRFRSDDNAGPAIVQEVFRQLPEQSHVQVATPADPAELLDLWEGIDFVIVVDAVRAGQKPGTLVLLEMGAETTPASKQAWPRTARDGTHALGLAACIELARVLGRLPRRVVVVGVEASDFTPGDQLSAPVAKTFTHAVDVVLDLLRQAPAAEATRLDTSRGFRAVARQSEGTAHARAARRCDQK